MLFTPFRLRGLTLANRFVMSPMNRNAAPGGIPADDLTQFYVRRVAGEVGLIVTGGNGIDHPSAVGIVGERECRVPELHGAALPAWQRLVDAVHAAGGKIVPQLWHQGVMRAPGTGHHPEAEPASPSGVWGPAGKRTDVAPAFLEILTKPGRALRDDEIVEIIDAYGRSARNAVALGVDGIAIHGAIGYLPDAFLWEETNQRTDRWGGDRRARTRFAVEVVRAVRRAAGEVLPVFFRFSQWKHQDLDAKLAHTPSELEEILGPLADAGVDVFDATQFTFDDPEFAGSELNLAGWAKKLTGKAAMTVGGIGLSSGINDPRANGPPVATDNLAAVEQRMARGEFDLAGVGRSLLQDAAWTRKVRLGEPFEQFDPASLRTLK